MHVLFVLDDFLPYPSGAGGFVMTWAFLKYLRREGHQVSVCRYGMGGTDRYVWIAEAQETLEEMGVPVYELPAPAPLPRLTRWARLRRAFHPRTESFYPAWIEASAFQEVWKASGADVLYLFTMKAVTALRTVDPLPPSIASVIDLDMELLAARRKHIGIGSRLGWLYGLLDRIAERRLPDILVHHLRRCRGVIEHAAHHARWLEARGVSCVYCPNPVEDPYRDRGGFPARTPPEREVFKVALIGAIRGVSTIAGLRYFARELLPVLTDPPGRRLEFHIIGKGELPADVAARVAHDPRVRVRGFVPDIEAEFRDADILLVPTPMSLGFRTRIAHGFGFGAVVVAHAANAEGMPELRDGENCRLGSTPQAFERAFHDLAGDADQWTRLSGAARATFASSYDNEVVCRAMVREFERLVSA